MLLQILKQCFNIMMKYQYHDKLRHNSQHFLRYHNIFNYKPL